MHLIPGNFLTCNPHFLTWDVQFLIIHAIISSSYHVGPVSNPSSYSRGHGSYIASEAAMYAVFWWDFHWFPRGLGVFEARLSLFCRACNRFSCWDTPIRKMMNYLLLEELQLIMRLILFGLLFPTKTPPQFAVEIPNGWVWNQDKVDLTIWMHSARPHPVKRWIVAISIDYLSGEMCSMPVAEHFRPIHSCVDCIQQSGPETEVFHRKWLILALHFEISRFYTSPFSFHQ